MTPESDPIRVLFVDDEPAIREAYRQIVASGTSGAAALEDMEAALFGAPAAPKRCAVRVEAAFASQGEQGCALAAAARAAGRAFAVAFVDMRMPPGWDGVETIERLWKADPEILVVVATAHSDRPWDEIAARLGRTDHLLLLRKPFDPEEVRQFIASLGEKWRLARAAERDLVELHRLTTELAGANERLCAEIVERKAAQDRLRRQAYYDALTGLPNRVRLTERLDECVARVRRDPTKAFAVLFFDLDNFKLVNDSLGHAAGDRLLVEVARRLRDGVRDLDLVARTDDDDATSRLGGDEFVVVLDDTATFEAAVIVAERLRACIARPIDLGVQHVSLSASVGIAIGGPDHDAPDLLLRDSDTAMYSAKVRRSGYAIFDPKMHADVSTQLSIESDLRRAVANQHFTLVFQPIVSSGNGRIVRSRRS